jgi:hypothetical protein
MIALRVAGATMLVCLLACAAAASAFAAPKLVLREITPDTVRAGEEVVLAFWVQNVGDTATQGPIGVVDPFGSQVANVSAEPHLGMYVTGLTSSATPINAECEGGTTSMSCEITCTLQPGVQVAIQAVVTIPPEATGSISDLITVSGGGAARPTE